MEALRIGQIKTCLRVAFDPEFSVRVLGLLLTFNLQLVKFHQVRGLGGVEPSAFAPNNCATLLNKDSLPVY